MEYVIKKDNCEEYYSVSCNLEKLKELLPLLKNYKYFKVDTGVLTGDITKWPATKKNIIKRVSKQFYAIKDNENALLYPETIVYNKEKGYVTYESGSYKYPILYHLVDLIANQRDLREFLRVFKNEIELDIISPRDLGINWSQYVLDAILNYANNDELTKNSGINDEDYDYKGLNELYIEVLKCFTFQLESVKEYKENAESVNGLHLIKKI